MKMAKTTKAVKKSAASKGTSSQAKVARPGKTTSKKTARAKKPTPSKGKATAKGNGTTKALTSHVSWVASLIPGPLGRITYVQRTLSILDDGARKRANLRRRQVKQLGQVWGDLQRDVHQQLSDVEQTTRKRIDGIADKVRDTRVAQEVNDLPERVTETFDQWLDRVGLVRKSVSLHTHGPKALPARTR